MNTSLESVRKYWDARPCNIRHSPRPVGTREYFADVEARKYYVEPHIPAFADFPAWKDKRVLEIGCGIGTDTISFARAGARVTAIDLSEESVRVAQQRAEVFDVANRIRFHTGDAEHLSTLIAPEIYDLIYSFGVIHHSPTPENILHELRHYTDQDTVLKLMVYNRRSWKALWILATYGGFRFWDWDNLIREYSEAQTGSPVTYTYTPQTIRMIVENAGFGVDHISVDHIFPYKIPEYTHYQYEKEIYFRYLPDEVFHALERVLGWHLLVTAHWEGA